MNKYLYYLIVFCSTLFYGCKPSMSSRIAETKAIDKVTPELAKAVTKYDKVSMFNEGVAIVQKDGKYGYINKLGEEIIPCKYDKAEEFYNGLAVVGEMVTKDSFIYGCINLDDEMVIPLKYDNIGGFKLNQVTPARFKDKEGAIDVNGIVVIPFEYKLVAHFFEDMALVINENNKVGFMDINGKLVIPFNYSDNRIEYFSEGLVPVENEDGKCGFIDKDGREVIPFVYDWAKPFHCGYAAVGYDSNLEMEDGIPSYSFKNSYINKNGDIVMRPISNGTCEDFSEKGYARIHINYEGYGLIDRRFNVILPFEYSVVYDSFSTNELITVMNFEHKHGVFDTNKKEFVIPCEYESMDWAFQEGYISAMKDEKEGFLDKNGNVVIPFCYDSASGFSEGFAVVERYGQYGYVDRYGNDTFSIK